MAKQYEIMHLVEVRITGRQNADVQAFTQAEAQERGVKAKPGHTPAFAGMTLHISWYRRNAQASADQLARDIRDHARATGLEIAVKVEACELQLTATAWA